MSRRALIPTCAFFALVGCTPVIERPIVHDCPKIVDYSADQQNQAADELEAMQYANHHPRYPMVSRMMTDYGRERAALMPCQ
jgi:hypothetical protein